LRSKLILILFVLVAIGSVVEFNRHHLSRLSIAQQRFEQVVRGVGEAFQQEERTGESFPELYVSMKSSLPTISGHWELRSSYDEENPEKYQQALRLLELANTARIFNQSDLTGTRDSQIEVVTKVGKQSFKTNLSPQIVGQSLAIQKLIILLQQYTARDTETL